MKLKHVWCLCSLSLSLSCFLTFEKYNNSLSQKHRERGGLNISTVAYHFQHSNHSWVKNWSGVGIQTRKPDLLAWFTYSITAENKKVIMLWKDFICFLADPERFGFYDSLQLYMQLLWKCSLPGLLDPFTPQGYFHFHFTPPYILFDDYMHPQ